MHPWQLILRLVLDYAPLIVLVAVGMWIAAYWLVGAIAGAVDRAGDRAQNWLERSVV